MSDDLEPIGPAEALVMWLDYLVSDRSDSTVESYEYRLEPFVQWCEDDGIENMNDLSGRDIHKYISHLRSRDLERSYRNNIVGTLKRFIGYLENIEAVPEATAAKIEVPALTGDEKVHDEKLKIGRAVKIKQDLRKYEYASGRHARFELLDETACRLGGLVSLDISDFYFSEDDLERLRHVPDISEEAIESVELPFIYFRHRPETGTPLKNKYAGERPVGLPEDVGEIIKEYIEINRIDCIEDDGTRHPLFTTKQGDGDRISTSAVRREIYILTQPCRYGTCPHNRDTDDCEALKHGYESRCPSSRSPHPMRSGAITRMLDNNWPIVAIAERVNATPQVIREHYDSPDPIRRLQSRRSFVDGEDAGDMNDGEKDE